MFTLTVFNFLKLIIIRFFFFKMVKDNTYENHVSSFKLLYNYIIIFIQINYGIKKTTFLPEIRHSCNYLYI